MSIFSAELFGTLVLVLLGDGVVANVLLTRSKGFAAGWLAIATGWALAVTLGVYIANAVSGAHLNPAVTLALAVIGKLDAGLIPNYLAGQMIGGFLGAVLVWLAYLPHWKETGDQGAKLGIFCTAPAIRHAPSNLLCEIIATAVLLFGVLAIARPENLLPNTGWDKGFAPALVGLLVWGLGLSLGGPTGYALNPARDLAPRLAHAFLPIAGKGGSDWGYAWVPVVGPVLGGILGAVAWRLANG